MSSISNIGVNITRTTSQLSSGSLLSGLGRTQTQLLKLQQAISTGKLVNSPGDAPAKTSAIMYLHKQLEARDQYDRNLSHASTVLNATDAAFADIGDILIEARSIASSQIGVGSDADTRGNQAVVIDGMLQALNDIINRTVAGVSLFAGGQVNDPEGRAFIEKFGGLQYVGAESNLANSTGSRDPLGFNANGADVFNAISSRVNSVIDLAPDATAGTRISDVGGGRGLGVSKGTIELTVNGTSVNVDLSTADTLGDVVARVNNAITQIDPAAGGLAVTTNGFSVTANAGHTIAIGEVATGTTARDLGIELSAAGATVVGQDIDPKLTVLTNLGDLGTAVDFTGGLTITHGGVTKVADFSGAQTVQDVINVIDQLDIGVRLSINDAGDGLNLVSDVSGASLSISEAGGGTTAGDLGLRTLGAGTLLEDLNFGRGVSTIEGEDDFEVTLSDGSNFAVNLDGAVTLQDVVDAISDAASVAGLTVGSPGDAGTDFNIGFAVSGNGLQFDDNTGGAGTFEVSRLGLSVAAIDLGIEFTATPGQTSVVGEDVGQVQVDSFLTALMNLRTALENNDERGITFAGSALERHINSLARERADVSVRAQRADAQTERSVDLRIAEQSLLSELQDADLTQVITEFQQLQLQLQASLQVGSQSLQLSFLDFLR